MKKLILLGILITLFSCVKLEIPTSQSTHHNPLSEQKFSVKKNKATVLLFNTDTLAVLTSTDTVNVPVDSEIQISEIDNTNNNLENRYKLFETIAFEDSKDADYDYNDLVIHAKIVQKNNNTQISVQPIAMGATKTIALGINIEGKDYYITKDCRKDLFKGKEGFINTNPELDRIKYKDYTIKNFPTTKCTYGKSLNWFIEVSGLRFYAVSKNYPTPNRPYGLIFIDINPGYYYKGILCGFNWFDYPSENTSIETVYPDFFDQTKTFKEIYNNKNPGYYKAIKVINNNVDEDCLYAIKG